MMGVIWNRAANKYLLRDNPTLFDLFCAVKYLARARDHGVQNATLKLRKLLLDIPCGDERRIPLFREAALCEDPLACWTLAEHLGYGDVCEKNVEESIMFFIKCQDCETDPFASTGRDVVTATNFFTHFEYHLEFALFLAVPPPCSLPHTELAEFVSDVRNETLGASVLDEIYKNYTMCKIRKLFREGRATLHEDNSLEQNVLSGVVQTLNDDLFRAFSELFVVVEV